MEDKIELEGVLENGYGIIPKKVMQDKDLSIQAKGVYSYLCSFSGKGNDSFPSRNKITHDLHISNNSLGKYLNELKGKRYIEVKQIKENGKFSNNIYKICFALPLTKLPYTEITVSEDLYSNNNKDSNNNINNIVYRSTAKEIIDYLNQKTGKHYKYTETNIKKIKTRFEESFTKEDFITVIDKKCEEWLNTDYEKFLRPETLFGSKFEGYLNQKQYKKKLTKQEESYKALERFMSEEK